METAIIIARKICDEVLDGESGRLIPIYVDASLCEWRNFDEQNTEKYWLTTEQVSNAVEITQIYHRLI